MIASDAHITIALPLLMSVLDLSATSNLNLDRFGLVIYSADLALVNNLIRSGRIMSSLSAPNFRLAAIVNSNGAGGPLYSSFEGATGLTGNEVLVLYTLAGDLNLDRTVSIGDFIDLAAHFHQSPATWR